MRATWRTVDRGGRERAAAQRRQLSRSGFAPAPALPALYDAPAPAATPGAMASTVSRRCTQYGTASGSSACRSSGNRGARSGHARAGRACISASRRFWVAAASMLAPASRCGPAGGFCARRKSSQRSSSCLASVGRMWPVPLQRGLVRRAPPLQSFISAALVAWRRAVQTRPGRLAHHLISAAVCEPWAAGSATSRPFPAPLEIVGQRAGRSTSSGLAALPAYHRPIFVGRALAVNARVSEADRGAGRPSVCSYHCRRVIVLQLSSQRRGAAIVV